MKKINQKGFVLLETVVITVFIISIFTFVYMSVVPLIGRYDELYNNYELEKTYELYHIRDAIYKDENFSDIISGNYKIITANDFNDKAYFNNLLGKLFDNTVINNNDYKIVYIKNIDSNLDNALSFLNLKNSFKEYIRNIKKNQASGELQNFIFLREGKRFAYLGIATDLDYLTKYYTD